ncbi:DNA topoisomerase 2-alpha isoform X2 [Ischnura elegans]|uniref:DNA topoisomerase 2-alpha isoform X2 n=1 Tax=Ischnura elegans TaxID=197161 RepID=UPI001ED879B0|nr:DNA topoisomerase 2-alpha isoform X2 [Ischnura elegans]
MEISPGESVLVNGDHGGEAEGAKKPPPAKKLAVEKIYQKKSQLEHILIRPDTYIGSVEHTKQPMWVYDEEENKIVQREITYVPGLYKIFDEILVNAADNKQKDPKMDCIKVEIDPEKNYISVWNNGKGIPVVEHKDEKMFVPTMIFGHLLTSSNYNDEEAKVTGGRNGYGAKLCNIFSTKFTVETACKEYKKYFKQTWTNNMGKASEVKLVDYNKEDFTRVAFSPDLAKFKMETLDKDIVSLMSRRAYDVAATTRGVNVYLNGKKLPVKTFKDYCELYLKDKKEDESGNAVKCVHEVCSERWEVAVTVSDEGFQQVSFVNSIATTKGGRHVDYITEMIIKHLMEVVKKKNKGGFQLKQHQIRNHLWVFVNCLIVNPTFDSQTKETMTLQVKNFGSKCKLSDKFLNSIAKSGIIESILMWAKTKAEIQLKTKCSGKKQNKLKGIPKLEDANDAGSRNSLDCTLILTEGDSAKTVAVTGLAVVGRDKYGVFPLRGKLLNVREATHKQLVDNQEIDHITKIMGLQYKKVYNTIDDMKTLRYGRLMIMTDQDQDGSHIKGLLINFIHHNWPSLLKLPFLEEFITPIVKATKGNNSMRFYSLPEFEDWKKDTENWYTYKIKYYKGLGTSTANEAREYFNDMARHRVLFKHGGPQDDHSIIMAFSKKCVDQRKEWLTTWMEDSKRRRELGLSATFLYQSDTKVVTYSDFVNKELVLFSNLDNVRSLPCLVDGLKPGQRKVVFTCLKRNDKREIKVAQLAGSVAEHSAYHHGEVSLMSTIINLAQNFVGSNNINILQPIGQFGSRLQGGKDAASPRYIFTMLSPLARLIFHPHDEALLNHLNEDNQKIEPEYYVPVIPMVLVNGADGIGTGWMTKIPNYNPREIIDNIKRLLDGEEIVSMKPWYKNFRGTVTELAHQRVMIAGEISILGPTSFEITELPIGTWTQAYKETVLEPMLHGANDKTPQLITDYKEYNSDTTVRFVVHMTEEKLAKAEEEGLHKVFKLQTVQSLTSMVCFDANGCLKKYESVEEILKEYFEVRLKFYEKRKNFLEGMLQAETSKISNQARFICEKCDGVLVIENKKKKAMIEELVKRGYDSDPVKTFKLKQNKEEVLQEIGESGEVSQEEESTDDGLDFDYLLGMTMWSLTKERKDELLKKQAEKQQEYRILQATTPAQIWRTDLDNLREMLDKVEEKELEAARVDYSKQAKGPKGKQAGKRKGGAVAIEVMPSPIGRKVAPRIGEELIKKFEKAVWAKENKGKRMPKVKKEKEEEKDEFDAMCDGKTPTLAQRVGNSPEAVDNKLKAKKAVKQTKLNFGKKSKKMDDEDSDSFDEDMDFGGSEEVVARGVPKRAAAAKAKLSYDIDDEDAIFSSDSEKWGGEEASDAQISVSGSDSEFEVTKKKTSKPAQSKALPEPRNSDSLFDSLVGSSPEKPVAPSAPAPVSISEPPPPSVSNGTYKRSLTDSSDEDSAPPKAPPKKKPAAARPPKEPKEPKPRAKPAKKPAAKKRSMDSDSDEEFELIKPKGKGKSKDDDDDDFVMNSEGEDEYVPAPPPARAAAGGRARKPVKYALSSDDDDSD